MKQKEIMREMQMYIYLSIIIFLVVGIIIGALAFPRVDWYETPRETETMFVNYNGEAVPYGWNATTETYQLYDGIWFDADTDRYYCSKTCWSFITPYKKGDDLPNIPPIDRKSPSEVEEKYSGHIMFTEIEFYDTIEVYDEDYYPYGVEVMLYDISYILYNNFCERPQDCLIYKGMKAVLYKVDNQATQPIPKFEVLDVTYSGIYNSNFGYVVVFEKIGYVDCGG